MATQINPVNQVNQNSRPVMQSSNLLHRRVLPVRPRSYCLWRALRHRQARQMRNLKLALVEFGKSGLLLLALGVGAMIAAIVNGGQPTSGHH